MLENPSNQKEENSGIQLNKSVETRESKLFGNKKIYVEIFNNSNDVSDLLDDIVTTNGGQVLKRLVKNLDYIIFKEGKEKTLEYALDNNINVLNPLWVDTSIKKGELQPIEKFLVKKTYTEIYINKPVVRKYHQLSPKKDEIESETNKKKKIFHTPIQESNQIKVLSEKISLTDNIKPQSASNLPNNNNKITAFFKPQTKIENKIKEEKEILSILVNISSILLGEEGKFKLNTTLKSLGVYRYIGESLENISKSEYVVVNEVHSRNDIRYIYCLIHKKLLLSMRFFIESKNNEKYMNIEDFIISPKVNLENLSLPPFSQELFKFYIHPSVYQKEIFRKETYKKLLELLGAKLEENIRLSDICIINRQDMAEHFPGHVRMVNETFIFECFYNWKVCDFEKINSKPEKFNIKK